MKQYGKRGVYVHIADNNQDYADVRTLLTQVYGAPEMGLHRRKDVKRQSAPVSSATRVVLVRVGDEPVGTMAITAKAFAPPGEPCHMEIDEVYQRNDFDENDPRRQVEDTAEVSRVAIVRKHRCPSVSSALYLYAAQYSLLYKLYHWIGGVDLQTDCPRDAALMGRVLAAQGYLEQATDLLLARTPERAITPRVCGESALRHFYWREKLAALPISSSVRRFSESWGARVCGPIVLHPHYQRYVIAMQVHVPRVMAIQQPIRNTADRTTLTEVV